MVDYREYLNELKSATLFQGIEDGNLIAMLDVMQPEIKHIDEGGELPVTPPDFPRFAVFLRGYPQKKIEERRFKYDMPKFGEPGMMMGEIPSLSEMNETARPMKKMRFPKGGKGMPKRAPMDVMLMSGEMITKFYNSDISSAQSKMLRNFLGILAQKVTDIRHDLFLAKDNFDIYGESDKTLNIFTAGCAMGVVNDVARMWSARHPELRASVTPGGSVDLVKRVIDGEPCDVIISADDKLFSDMLVPKYAEGFTVFAGNSMVIVPTGDKEINSENWRDVLLSDGVTFGHHSPYGDPGGYRVVMAMLLADYVEKGLSEKLMNSTGHLGMDKEPPKERVMPDFMFGYASGPISQGKPYAELPDVMNLGEDSLAELYAKVSFAVDAENTVTATPIAHAVAVPLTAVHKDAANNFVEMFLSTDFTRYGFKKR